MLPYKYYKAGDQDKAVELISDFCMQLKNEIHSEKDPFWECQAMDLLMGLILILFEAETDEKKIHMESIQRIRIYIGPATDYSDDPNNIFWKMVETFPERSLIRLKLASVYNLRHVEKTLNCVISTFDSMVRCFLLNKKLMSMTDSSEFEFEEIVKEKTALYLITPDEKTTFHFLVSVFVKQCYEVFIDYAQKCKGGVLPVRVNYILDEFSNFPQISDMPAMISAARSRNIRFILVVQSKQQLLSGYGDTHHATGRRGSIEIIDDLIHHDTIVPFEHIIAFRFNQMAVSVGGRYRALVPHILAWIHHGTIRIEMRQVRIGIIGIIDACYTFHNRI